MIIGRTLGIYIALRFIKLIAGVFFTIYLLIFTLDFVELMRRAGDARDASAVAMATLAFYRAPSIAEQVLPFAVLFGAMGALLGLSRKLELVVARAAGVSAWQFLQPGLAVGAALGIASVLLFNPMAASFRQKAGEMEAAIFAKSGRETTDKVIWLRQKSVDGQSVIRAISATEQGLQLNQVTFYNYDPEGLFIERVEAARAVLRSGYWELSSVRVISIMDEPRTYESSVLATNLEVEQIRRSFTPADQVSYWDLPEVIDRTERAGLDATRYRLQEAALTARPVLLLAMILVAATVSLRFFRFGGVARMVLGGVIAGFVLYVATELTEDLGANGIIGPAMAAWLPAILGSLLGVLALLHLEDG
ncbi:MAG: LPS export ABC transporter permease LptG [Bosea sp.]|jgi:lipopolysaccharide export system permease protein|nr:LPS export ABC transporter permease LptG [Bosea sp. (in: a-proteobacteria)]